MIASLDVIFSSADADSWSATHYIFMTDLKKTLLHKFYRLSASVYDQQTRWSVFMKQISEYAGLLWFSSIIFCRVSHSSFFVVAWILFRCNLAEQSKCGGELVQVKQCKCFKVFAHSLKGIAWCLAIKSILYASPFSLLKKNDVAGALSGVFNVIGNGW